MNYLSMKKAMEVSEGKAEGDILITNINLVNVMTKKVEKANILIAEGLIVNVDFNLKDSSKQAKMIINGDDKYLIPGLIDAHTHIEMSLLSPKAYADAVLSHGTTAALLDMHDICNVSVESMYYFAKELVDTKLKSFLMIPPCVPATPELETAGGEMNLEELRKINELLDIKGIGETMDFNRVLNKEEEIIKMLSWAKDNNYPIDGHCPGLMGNELQAYMTAGVSSDHESGSLDEMLEKHRLGMKVILRRGSIDEPVRAGDFLDRIEETSNILLATDGCIYLDDLINNGHMIYALKQIISEGADPITAIQMATINVARAYGLDNKIGSISPGKIADMIIVDDLENLNILNVIVDGEVFTPDKNKSYEQYDYPESVLNSVKINNINLDDLKIKSNKVKGTGKTKGRIIDVTDTEVVTGEFIEEVNVIDGVIEPDTDRDILKVAVIDRFGKEGDMSLGLIRGFGLKSGAFGGTIGQDSQNLVVVGTNDNDILKVIEKLEKIQGGLVLVNNGQVISSIPLPIGGIMTTTNPWKLNNNLNNLSKEMQNLGCPMNYPYFALSLMITCAVIPELKMTNKGLVDANLGKFVPLEI